MKVKTSVSLSKTLISEIDQYLGSNLNRSQFIEIAVSEYMDHLKRQKREDRDRKLINEHHEALNEFMTDVLEYQSEPF